MPEEAQDGEAIPGTQDKRGKKYTNLNKEEEKELSNIVKQRLKDKELVNDPLVIKWAKKIHQRSNKTYNITTRN